MTSRMEDDEAEKAFDCPCWLLWWLVGNDKKMGGCAGVMMMMMVVMMMMVGDTMSQGQPS